MKRKDADFIRSASLVSALTFLSRLLGLVREVVCAYFFGAGRTFDAFAIAFRIPNLSRRLFGEGALTAAVIPVLTSTLKRNRGAAIRLLGSVTLALSWSLVGLTLLGETALVVVRQFYPDSLVVPLAMLMLPYMVFICLVALFAAAHHVIGRFGMPALMPIVFNLLLIAALVIGSQVIGHDQVTLIYVLAATVVLAGVVQLLLQWSSLARANFRPDLRQRPYDAGLKPILTAWAPMLIGLGAVQLNSLADLLVAWVFVPQEGAVSVLSYGERLYQLPLGLCGIALATAIFPRLSRLADPEEAAAFGETLQLGLRLALFIGIPASVGLWGIRSAAVRVLLERGAFSSEDSTRAAAVVGWYGLGVWAYILQQVFVRAYYALRDSRSPMRIATVMVLVNLALNILLVQVMAESGVALATAVTSIVHVAVLAGKADRLRRPLAWNAIWRCAAKTSISSLVMLAVILLAGGVLGSASDSAAALLIYLAAGVVTFWAVSKLLQSQELAVLREVVIHRNS